MNLLAAGSPFEHTWNSWNLHLYAGHVDLRSIPGFEALGITNFVVMMLVAAALLLVVGLKCGAEARRAQAEGRCTRGLAAAVEVVVQWFRDEVLKGALPHHYKNPLLASILLSFFFFILFCNLIGLMPQPFGHTATGSPWVTGALAFGGTLGCIFVFGMIEKGPIGFFTGLVPHGVPLLLWPLLFIIELVGVFVKPFALMIRLAANMTAGHIILAVLVGFLTADMSAGSAALVWPASAFGYLAISLFEIVIAFIQAYIFTHLSAVFIGQALSHDH